MDVFLPLSRKLASIGRFSADELSVFAHLETQPLQLAAGDQVQLGCAKTRRVVILAEGWVARARTLADGRRQIVSIALPGDFIGLHNLLGAKTYFEYDVIVAGLALAMHPDRLLSQLPSRPHLFMRIMWFSAQDSFMAAEHLVGTGKRSAYERTLHFLLETWHRLRRIGQADAQGFALHLNQQQLGDVLGLTPVHISRVLGRLRQDGLVSFNAGQPRRVRFNNAAAAAKACEFSAEYLDFPPFA